MPLLSGLIQEQQPGEDEVMRDRAERWTIQETNDRAYRAQKWRQARQELAALPRSERTILRHAWNGAPYPATPIYLLGFLHSYRVGGFTLDAIPFDPKTRTDANGCRVETSN